MNAERVEPLLKLEGVNTYYGSIHILTDSNLYVGEGELVCLLGGNASGKSTTLKTILGLVRPRTGTVTFAGEDVTNMLDVAPDQAWARDRPREPPPLRPDDRAREPRDGVVPAAEGRSEGGVRARLHALPAAVRASVAARRDAVGRRAADGRDGSRAHVAARACCSWTSRRWGSRPILVERSFEIIQQVHESGVAMLIVEQNANVSLSIADRGYVLSTGRIVLEGKASELIAERGSA